MPSTTLGIPFPTGTDLVSNGPAEMQALATQVDLLLPHVVTTLPGSPFDGQLIDYVADSTAGVVWRFRYRAASPSAHKWEFVGGPALYAGDGGSHSGTSGTSGTWQAPNTGNALVVPFAGDYQVEVALGATITSVGGANITPGFATTGAPSGVLGQGFGITNAGSSMAVTLVGALLRALELAASTITPVIAFNVSTQSWSVFSSVIRLLPVRIG
jgi:hypothetical protein